MCPLALYCCVRLCLAILYICLPALGCSGRLCLAILCLPALDVASSIFDFEKHKLLGVYGGVILYGVAVEGVTARPNGKDFVGALVLDLNMVNEIMLDKLDSGEDYHDVACRWLKNHETAWTAWLPDSTKCFPQFGLYLERAKTFVDSRQDPTGLTCRACESGYYSAPLNDDQGLTYICVPCPLGHAQPSGAALACAPCNSGEYQDEEASTSCKRCAISTYQDQKGQVSCLQCPTTTSTVGLGSVSFDGCRCEENSINTASRGSPSCVACGEGLNCPFASDLESLKTGGVVNQKHGGFSHWGEKGGFSMAHGTCHRNLSRCLGLGPSVRACHQGGLLLFGRRRLGGLQMWSDRPLPWWPTGTVRRRSRRGSLCRMSFWEDLVQAGMCGL